MKRLLMLPIVLFVLNVANASDQPPYAVKDIETHENFVDVYKQVSEHKHTGYDGSLTIENTFLPVGSVTMYVSTTAPAGWLNLDGSTVSRTTYAMLYSVIGTIGGAGDGSTTFCLPDMRRRVPVGVGGTGTSTLANTLGAKGGEETHTQTAAEVGLHGHAVNIKSGLATQELGASSVLAGLAGSGDGIGGAGGTANVSNLSGIIGLGGLASPFNQLQPSLVLNYIIYAGQ